MKYRCKVCGQIVEVAEGEPCPICGASHDKLVPIEEEKEGELSWACEHVIGVAQGVDEFVLQGCRDHFKCECSEVGMYLAMSRQALREAELLGEVVTPSTKENIKKMLAGENGACESKLAIAKKAKELGLDAIHDTVHEMARDEARHGKALEAMLNRYFK